MSHKWPAIIGLGAACVLLTVAAIVADLQYRYIPKARP